MKKIVEGLRACNLMLPLELIQQLDKEAKRRKISRSQLVREILENWLKSIITQ